MLFKANLVSDEYKGQFIEVEIGDDTNFVWLMIADGRETPTVLVGLDVRTVSDAVALALSMNIPTKING